MQVHSSVKIQKRSVQVLGLGFKKSSGSSSREAQELVPEEYIERETEVIGRKRFRKDLG